MASNNPMPAEVPARYRYWINSASEGTGLPKTVVAAQINEESGFQPDVTSSSGAEGFAQFLPSTYAAEGGTGSEYNAHNELNPYIRLTNQNLKWANGDVSKALAAYNAGQGNWQAGEGYAATILSAADQIGLTVKPKNSRSSPSGNPNNPTLTSDLTSFTGAIDDISSADFWERVGLVIGGFVLIIVGLIILALPAAKEAKSVVQDVGSVSGVSGLIGSSNSSSGGPTEEEKADRERRLSLAERNASVGESKAQTQLLRERRLSANASRKRHASGNEPNPNPVHN